DQLQVVKAVSKDLKFDERLITPKTILSRISHSKNHGKTPQNLLDDSWEPSWEYTANVFNEYEKRLKKSNALDFDDLLIKAVELFDKFPAAAEKYSMRFHYVMVDEYQDTNRTQYRLVRHLTRVHDNICVVGDRILYHQKTDPAARIAVLYRTNFLSRVLEEKLRRYNMKYRIVGGFSFYERAEIKDLISYLTVSLNPNDSVHLLRVINVPPR